MTIVFLSYDAFETESLLPILEIILDFIIIGIMVAFAVKAFKLRKAGLKAKPELREISPPPYDGPNGVNLEFGYELDTKMGRDGSKDAIEVDKKDIYNHVTKA